MLHSFNFNGFDGAFPYAGLVFDNALSEPLHYDPERRHLLRRNSGRIVAKPRRGGWTEKVLHSFNPSTTDGVEPLAGLIIDHAGKRPYGTTYEGGTHYSGTVFELSPNGSGDWTEKGVTPLQFKNAKNADGTHPYASLLLDGAGLISTARPTLGALTTTGRCSSCRPMATGARTEKVLHSFNNNGADGVEPFDGLIMDSAGGLYGTTSLLAVLTNSGVVFEDCRPMAAGAGPKQYCTALTPLGSGDWICPLRWCNLRPRWQSLKRHFGGRHFQ